MTSEELVIFVCMLILSTGSMVAAHIRADNAQSDTQKKLQNSSRLKALQARRNDPVWQAAWNEVCALPEVQAVDMWLNPPKAAEVAKVESVKPHISVSLPPFRTNPIVVRR